ncbi:hypothetical protein ACLMAL_31825 [Nocardia sp. CWNU-33]
MVGDPNLNVPVDAYTAPVGTAFPDDLAELDAAVWSPAHEAIQRDSTDGQ